MVVALVNDGDRVPLDIVIAESVAIEEGLATVIVTVAGLDVPKEFVAVYWNESEP